MLFRKPFVIPIFIPHMGCSHRCVFCNQKTITGIKSYSINDLDITDTINSFLQYHSSKRSSIQVAFYGGNFLALSKKNIIKMLKLVSLFIEKKSIDSIRFSTRPESVNLKTISLIKPYLVKTVEIGTQSMNDNVLNLSKRGHTSIDTIYAVNMLKSLGYNVGLQMMLGLPGDNEKIAINTAEIIASLSPNFVRIYPTVVVRNSLLSVMHRKGTYTPLCLDEAVSLTKKIFLIFRKYRIPVIRMGLQASKYLNFGKEIIAGPYHPAFGHMVYSEIFLDAIRSLILQMKYKPTSVTIRVHSKNVSRVQGLKCKNIENIKREFNLNSFLIEQNDNIDEEYLYVCDQYIKIY